MKVYGTNEIKNIALIGSKGSGKTTLAEAMLFECGVIKRRGTIDSGNTVCDYFPVEKEYGYSVFSTVCYAEFLNKKLNVIDCPGGDDFVGSAITALNVTDTGVLLIDAQYGVEVGSQNIFRVTEKIKKPVIFAVNQLDGDKVDFDNVINQMKEVFGNKVVLVQYPINPGTGFNAMIDVLLMKMYKWGPDGGVPTITDIPAEEMEKAKELNKVLVEAAAENDESLMEKFFDQGMLSEDEMREAHPQRLGFTRHSSSVLRKRFERYGCAPHDGIPRQRCAVCRRHAKTRRQQRRGNRSRQQRTDKLVRVQDFC